MVVFSTFHLLPSIPKNWRWPTAFPMAVRPFPAHKGDYHVTNNCVTEIAWNMYACH